MSPAVCDTDGARWVIIIRRKIVVLQPTFDRVKCLIVQNEHVLEYQG